MKLMVWAAVTSKGIIGPYFFDGTVDGPKYKDMIKEYYIPALRRKRIPLKKVIFQQDGATIHCTLENLELLKKKFGGVMSRRLEFVWPSCSPDLNPCDFFLWGYLQSRFILYRTPLRIFITHIYGIETLR